MNYLYICINYILISRPMHIFIYTCCKQEVCTCNSNNIFINRKSNDTTSL